MRTRLKKILPEIVLFYLKILRNTFRILLDFKYELVRYLKYSASLSFYKNQETFDSYLIKEYHAIEKGLSLLHSKPWFGIVRIEKLMVNLRKYDQIYNRSDVFNICLHCLNVYLDINSDHIIENKNFKDRLETFVKNYSQSNIKNGGIINITNHSIDSHIDIQKFQDFIKSRRSVRDFNIEQKIDGNIIKEVVIVVFVV